MDSAATDAPSPHAAGGGNSDGSRFSGVTPARYPGYNPAGPYTWPSPNPSAPVSQRKIIAEVLKANGHTITHYGVRKDITSFALSVPMQLFAMDAFWWLFLQHFSMVDFESHAERTRRNVMVTDSEVLAYMGASPVAFQPKRPVKRQVPNGGLRDAAQLPSHLTQVRGRLRTARDIVAIGTPSLRSASSSSNVSANDDHTPTLMAALDEVTGVADDDVSSVASSYSYSPSESSGVTHRSDVSVASAATVDGIMRVTRFAMTFPAMAKLVPEVRDSVIAREQHQLFTRMSIHYAKAVQRLAPKHHTVKDAITRLLPDLLSQSLFSAFWQCIPYATQLFDLQFQREIGKSLSFWIGGVERAQNPRMWPIHHALNTIYKKGPSGAPKKLRQSSSSARMKSPGKLGSTAAMRQAKDAHLRRIQNATAQRKTPPFKNVRPPTAEGKLGSSVNPGLISLPHATATARSAAAGAPSPAFAPKPPAHPANTASSSARQRVVEVVAPAGGSASNLISKPSFSNAPFASLDDTEEFMLTPDQRRARAVQIEVAEMRLDLLRLTTTHTFSQVLYQGSGVGRAEGANFKPPDRVTKAFQLGPQKRTVQVIKADLDAKYIDEVPWYANQHSRTRIREQSGIAKFALSNWSPLLHRFMLTNGAQNANNADSIKWTV